MDRKGSLVVLSGFSGVGKGTVTKRIIEKYGYKLSISATTRDPRPGEVHGKSYFFLTKEEFLEAVEADGFIEYAQYVGNYYGTPKAYVQEKLEEGENIILEIEIQGALNVKERYPEAILIFITAPSAESLKNRLVNRGSESMEVIEERLQRAKVEKDYIDYYDYIVCNEDGDPVECVENCTDEIHNIIESEKKKVSNQTHFIAQLKENI